MRYYVVSMQRTGDASPASIFGYNTLEEARSAYHTTLASNYVSEVLDAFCVMLINEHGGVEAKEFWERPTN